MWHGASLIQGDLMIRHLHILFFCMTALHAQGTTLTIFTINDIYEVLPHNGQGGLAELATILKQERETADHYLTTVNGDFLSPSLISGVVKGAQMIDIMNRLEVDVVVFGNHEFDFGIDTLKQRMQESSFCWLGTNVLSLQKHKPLDKAQGSLVFDIDGIKIGMLGLCTTEASVLSQGVSDEITLTPVVLSAQATVHKLKKEGVDLIIALTHLGFSEDQALSEQVPEIDIILGGHDHEVITWYNGKTFIHKSGHDAQFLGRIDLKIEKQETERKTKISIYPSWKMIPNHNYAKDPEIAERVAFYAEKIDQELNQPIALCLSHIDSRNTRYGETTMGNLIADALMHALKADIAIINSGAIRGDRFYPSGTVLTKKDIQEELPFGGMAVLVEITGKQLLKTIEFALNRSSSGTGRFPQIAGLRLIYDSEHPNHKIRDAYIDGKQIEENSTYLLATNDYLLNGGDGNLGLKQSKVIIGPGIGPLVTSLVSDYLIQNEVIEVMLEGRILDCSTERIVKLGDSSGKRIHFEQEN